LFMEKKLYEEVEGSKKGVINRDRGRQKIICQRTCTLWGGRDARADLKNLMKFQGGRRGEVLLQLRV